MNKHVPCKSVLIVAVLILGVLIRILSIFGDLWLDEVWSLIDLRRAPSLQAALFSRSENTHILNTFSLWLLGEQSRLWAYRLPSLVAALGSLALLWRLIQPMKVKALPLMALTSLSYMMILYGTEARGYSLMLFFILLSWQFLLRYLKKSRPFDAAAFGFSVAASFLSQYEAVEFYVAALVWSCAELLGTSGFKKGIIKTGLLHAFPSAFVGAFYLFYLRGLRPGTGNIFNLADVAVNTLSIAYGGPLVSVNYIPVTVMALAIAGIVAAFHVVEIAKLYRERDSLWSFYFLAIFIVPVLIVFLMRREATEPRHFLPSILFSYFLMARMATRWSGGGRAGRALALLLLSACALGNALHTSDLLRHGRGEYSKALQYMIAHSPSDDPVTVSSDFDFRNRMLVDFYKVSLRSDRRLEYVDGAGTPARWYLKHSQDRFYRAPDEMNIRGGVYMLDSIFESAPLSGWNWFLFRRSER